MEGRQNALVTITTNPQSAQPLKLRLEAPRIVRRGVPFVGRLVADGGAGGNVFALAHHTHLPDGLTLDTATGEITGTPTTMGRVIFDATVQDSATTIDPGTFSIDVVGSLVGHNVTPVPGEVGVDYSYTLDVLNAEGPIEWSIIDGPLNDGLSLVGDTIEGTPTTASVAYLTLLAYDTVSGDDLVIQASLTVYPALVAVAVDKVLAPIGSYFSLDLPISGGVPPYTVTANLDDGGPLPPGLDFKSQRGALWQVVGVPTFPPSPGPAGNQDFLLSVDVVDALNATANFAMRITVVGYPHKLIALKNGVQQSTMSAVRIDFQGTAIQDVVTSDNKTTVTISPQANATSVLGTSGGVAGDAVSITASVDNRVLARVSGSLSWTQVTPAMIGASGSANNTTVLRGDGAWANGVTNSWSATSFVIASVQVVGARVTGFAAATGTADKTTFATYTSVTIGATYNGTTQLQLQAMSQHLQVVSQQLKAIKDALITHGLIGT